MSDPRGKLVVLRSKAHGIDGNAYVEALRERINHFEVVHARTAHAERTLIQSADIVTGGRISEEAVGRADRLKLFAAASAGTGHLPLEALGSAGVTVTNASGIHVPETAEHVLDQILTLLRRSVHAWERQQDHTWQHFQPFDTLAGKTATVVGLGPIGESVVSRLQAFDVETIGVRYTPAKGGTRSSASTRRRSTTRSPERTC